MMMPVIDRLISPGNLISMVSLMKMAVASLKVRLP